ncbi:ionotropic receptor 93a-like [Penaeus monodon]|uniref:ionotropic receptor 93a-like n=1 Tax=Penaeus monodon TaxID=6687 RepID=UPI0018A6DA76|nr:ionotropic receptor 93a-like [Penaeus monodon]
MGELWGKRLPNGTWNGLMGLLSRNEAHIGVANSFITDNNGRLKVLEYSQPYDVDESCFLIRSAAELPRWQSLALPFTPYVWLGVAVAFVCTSPFLFWLAKSGEARGESFRSLADSYLCAWGIQLREPHTFYPVCTSTRIFVASMWFSSVILTVAYSSHLTAFLTIRRRPAVPETFKDLYEGNIDVASIGEFFNISMAATGNYYLQSLSKRYFISKTLDEALVQVKLGKRVYISGRKALEYLISTQFSSSGWPTMRVMKECFAPYSIGATLQRHTPLKRSINLALERMIESGLINRWFSEALSRHRKSTQVEPDQTDTSKRDHVTPLNTVHMQGIFLILLFGYLVSTSVFMIEVLRGKNAQ